MVDDRMRDTRQLVLCETTDQVEFVGQQPDLQFPRANLIALTPEAAWACQQKGLPYFKLENFIDETKFLRHRAATFVEIFDWMESLEDLLRETVPPFKAASAFQPIQSSAFLFQNLLLEFRTATALLAALLSQTSPEALWYWTENTPQIDGHFNLKTSFVPYVLPSFLRGRRVALREAPALHNPAPPVWPTRVGLHARLMDLLTRRSWIGEALQLKTFGWRKYVHARFHRSRGLENPVLVLGCGYDMDALVMAMREEGWPVKWLQTLDLGIDSVEPLLSEPDGDWDPLTLESLPEPWVRIGASLLQEKKFWSLLDKWGTGRNTLFQAMFMRWWEDILPRQWRAYWWADAWLRRHPCRAVVAWEAGSGTLSAPVLQAARARNVPTVIYQHGGTSRTDALAWSSWMTQADVLLTYGTGISNQLQRTQPAPHRLSAKIIAVGSARLDSIRAGAAHQRCSSLRRRLTRGRHCKAVILYVPTVFGTLGRGYTDLAGYPDVSYFEMQQQILKVFADFPDLTFLYKTLGARNSLPNPLVDIIRKGPPHIQAINRPAVRDLIWAVDAIIVDHAITALGEALLTRKPVLVYDPGALEIIPEAPQARALLRKRARVSETPDDFVNDIRSFLDSGDFSEIQTPNDEFLCAFGTHLNDGRSAQRAVEQLLLLQVGAGRKDREPMSSSARCGM
jgi:hypothetical protein